MTQMPHPVLYHTPEEKRQARCLRNQQCYERYITSKHIVFKVVPTELVRQQEEYNARQRERYYEKKKRYGSFQHLLVSPLILRHSQMRAIAEKEHKRFEVPKAVKPPEPKCVVPTLSLVPGVTDHCYVDTLEDLRVRRVQVSCREIRSRAMLFLVL
jgi:hypothetical protein